MNENYSTISDEIKDSIEFSGFEKRPLFYYLADRDEDDLSDVEISEIVEEYLFDNNYQDYDTQTIKKLLSRELKDVSRYYLSIIGDDFDGIAHKAILVGTAMLVLWFVFQKNIILPIFFFAVNFLIFSTEYYMKQVHDTVLAERVTKKLEFVKRISDNIEHYTIEPVNSYRFLTMNENVTAQKSH